MENIITAILGLQLIMTVGIGLIFFRLRNTVTAAHLDDLAKTVKHIKELQEQEAEYRRTTESFLKSLDKKATDHAHHVEEQIQSLNQLIQQKPQKRSISLGHAENPENHINGDHNPGQYWSPRSGQSDAAAPVYKHGSCQATSADLERIGRELLNLIEPQGRSSPFARLSGLKKWLHTHHPGVEAEPIGTLQEDLWRLVILTGDQKAGVVLPALDSIIGPGEILKWFDGGRYDGTQALTCSNISKVAQAVRNDATQTWKPQEKGRIDLSA